MQLPSIRMFLNLIVFFLNSLCSREDTAVRVVEHVTFLNGLCSFEDGRGYFERPVNFLNSLYSFEALPCPARAD